MTPAGACQGYSQYLYSGLQMKPYVSHLLYTMCGRSCQHLLAVSRAIGSRVVAPAVTEADSRRICITEASLSLLGYSLSYPQVSLEPARLTHSCIHPNRFSLSLVQKSFWERSPWLSQGSLVLLRPQALSGRHWVPGKHCILAEVIHRDAEQLAGKKSVTGYQWARSAGRGAHRQRCMLGVSPCTAEDTRKGLSAFASFRGLNTCFANKQAHAAQSGDSASFGDFLASNVYGALAAASSSTDSESFEPVLFELTEISPDFGVSRAVLSSLQKIHASEGAAVKARSAQTTRLAARPFFQDCLPVAADLATAETRGLPLGDHLFVSPLTAHTARGPGSKDAMPNSGSRAAGVALSPEWQQAQGATDWIRRQLQRFDQAQTQAFDFALSHKVAMIQGPPGACPCV